jgi:hypothetical protein
MSSLAVTVHWTLPPWGGAYSRTRKPSLRGALKKGVTHDHSQGALARQVADSFGKHDHVAQPSPASVAAEQNSSTDSSSGPGSASSSHLPAAPGDMTERLLALLAAAPTAQRFIGPD